MNFRSLSLRHNWLVWGPWVIFGVGFALNQIVMGVNHGRMPVLLADCNGINPDDIRHVCMTTGSHLKIFADWVNMGEAILSPGDFLVLACQNYWTALLGFWFGLNLRESAEV